MPKVHIIEVTLRQAVRAESTEKASEVSREIFAKLAANGSLGDWLVFEWDNPVIISVEDDE